MTPDEWARITDIFNKALEREPAERGAFLDDACRNAPALKQEVESLLAHSERAGDFISTPAAPARALRDGRIGAAVSDRPDSTPAPIEAPPASRIGEQIGAYLITDQIGRGGMGVVYLADDTRLGRQVALKALPPEFTDDEARRQRLRYEARAAAGLSHPGIATVYALEEVGDQIYIVTEYVRGETLRDTLEAGPLPIPRVLEIALAVAEALADAHEHGVIHRDLKPENIMCTVSGQCKILDFGLARIRRPSRSSAAGVSATRLTEAGAIIGTPAYMSPEQLLGRDADARTDVFSFGVMLFELATGVHPFAGDEPASTIARILEGKPRTPTEHLRNVPPALAQVVRRCLRKDPEERYRTAGELALDLARVRDSIARGDRAPAAPESSDVFSPKWWWQFHQVLTSGLCGGLLYPLWFVRSLAPFGVGTGLFLALLMAVATVATLRLHLLFVSVFHPHMLGAQLAREARVIRALDFFAAAVFFVFGIGALSGHEIFAVTLIVIATFTAVSSIVIEPATTAAAFPRE